MKDFEYVKAKRFYETVAEFQKAWSGLGFTTEEMSEINDFRKLLLEKLNNKDMKKECRINEINEQIKELKKEKKELKEDKYFDLTKLELDVTPLFPYTEDSSLCVGFSNSPLQVECGGRYSGIAWWLTSNCNWDIVRAKNGITHLVPTKK